MTYRTIIVAGDRAVAAAQSGNYDVAELSQLGVCRVFEFENEQSREAFIQGVEFGTQLQDPLILSDSEPLLLC